MTLKDGEVVEEELENLPIYIVTVRQDEKLRFAQMDIMTGAEITDETPKIFSKE